MTANFQAEVFQNAYLPAGSTEVHALMTVTTLGAAIGKTSTARGDRLFGIICDTSGSMDGAKIQSAKKAIIQLIEMLPKDVHFFVIGGASRAKPIVSVMRADAINKEAAIKLVRSEITANGGTHISTWSAIGRSDHQTIKISGGYRWCRHSPAEA